MNTLINVSVLRLGEYVNDSRKYFKRLRSFQVRNLEYGIERGAYDE